MRPSRSPLPTGAAAIAGNLVAASITTYAFLAVTARVLGPERYAPVSVLWSAVFLVVPSVWGPVEQEVARRLSARSATGTGGAPVVRAGRITALAVGAPLVAVLAVTSAWSGDLLFSAEQGVALALAVAVGSFAVNHLTRASMAGAGSFGAYGACVSVDSASRLAIAGGLVAAGVRSPVPYAFAVALAPLVPAVWLQRRRPPEAGGPDERVGDLAAHVAPLIGGQVFAQVLVNGGPIAVAALAGPGEEAAAGRFLAAAVIARIPLFFFQAVQGSLLPGLARRHAAGERDRFVAQVRSLLAAVAGLGTLGVVACGIAGPAVVRLAFGEAFALGRRDLVALAAGTALFMAATVGAQAAVALAGHRSVGAAWASAVLVAGIAMAVTDGLLWRVELAFVAGTGAAACAQLTALAGALRQWHPPPPDPAVVARGDWEPPASRR